MATRFNSRSNERFGVAGLESGYNGTSVSSLTIPPVGVEDVDRALFKLFDSELNIQVHTSETNRQALMRVPVIFSAAEKWALVKRQKLVRDRNGSLILPLITVVRTSVEQSTEGDIAGRGINQQTGEIVIKRRLDALDRGHQGLINRMLLGHQANLAVSPTAADVGQLATRNPVGSLSLDPIVSEGGLMLPDRRDNVWETIVVPAPQFFTATYDVTLWAQYNFQATQMIEHIIASFLPQANSWKLETSKGYWFIARVEGNAYVADNNFEEMSAEERIIKHKLTVKVPGYILASGVPGAPVPLRRYVSSPTVSFDVGVGADEELGIGQVEEPFLGADDPTLPSEVAKNGRRDQRDSGRTRLYPGKESISPHDPALKNRPRGTRPAKYKKVSFVGPDGRPGVRYVRVSSANRNVGESTFSADDLLGGIVISIEDS